MRPELRGASDRARSEMEEPARIVVAVGGMVAEVVPSPLALCSC